jgi:hypothetical protein
MSLTWRKRYKANQKGYAMNPNFWLVLSSFSFLAPAALSIKMKSYDIASIYLLVSITSSAYHFTKNPYILYIDYPLNQLSHVMTVYKILPGGMKTMPYYFIWLTYTVYIYYYGYMNNNLIWNPDIQAATPWHFTMHISTAATRYYTLYQTHLLTSSLPE